MNIGTLLNLISLIIITIVYKRLQPKWLQLFFYFLLFTFITDLGATYYSQFYKKSNHFIINIYLLFNFIFYFLIFYKTFDTGKLKKIVSASVIIYLLIFICDIIFINGLFFYNIYSYCLGSILIVLCSLVYFMRLFTSENLLNYFKIPMFWIATGLLFYYVGTLVQYSLMEYIIKYKLGYIFYIINIILNAILFGAFSIGFLCNYKWKKIN